MTNSQQADDLLKLAKELWEDAEIRVLSSPWTSPTRFEGKVREHFLEKAAALKAITEGGAS